MKNTLVILVSEGFHGAAGEAVYPAILEQLGLKFTCTGLTELSTAHDKHLTKTLFGMDDDCIVNNYIECKTQPLTVYNKYRRDILVERYIDGEI
ncbi:MAG: hypothetical protein LBL45_00985 [Treponema sp.]|jgi:D-alanine-D-alanine ligase-like ATP-grasp enzyme|nr:hypothetical protein [Treponema sp.]